MLLLSPESEPYGKSFFSLSRFLLCNEHSSLIQHDNNYKLIKLWRILLPTLEASTRLNIYELAPITICLLRSLSSKFNFVVCVCVGGRERWSYQVSIVFIPHLLAMEF